MKLLEVVIPMTPVAKGRPRITTAGGFARSYTPAKTRAAEARIAGHLIGVAPVEPYQQALAVTLEVVLPVPVSWPKRKQAAALAQEEHPTGRPDIDNYVKLLFDAANGLLWRDDAQVVDLHANKRYGAVPGIRLRLSEAE